jgi:tetratricopeptide (TPR) repeat protein
VPNHWAAEVNIGIQLMARGKKAEALEHLYKGSAINPDEGYSGMIIGYHEQSLGHLQEAISRYQHALRDYNVSNEDRAHILRNMAAAYRDLGDLQKANECYAQALSLQSQSK